MLTIIMTDKDKIMKFLDYKGISKNKFYVKTGFSVGFLDSGSSLGVDKLKIIIDNYHDLNLEWFFNDNVPMLKKNAEKQVYKLKTDYNVANQSIPLYDIDAAAGLITLFDNQTNQTPIGELSIPNAPKCDGAVHVRGDSMYPILKSGDIIAYKTIHDPANIFFGEMYLIDLDVEGEQYLTIKYIQRGDKGDNYVYLVSQNQNHQPMHILKSNIRALALVKASIRYNSMG